MIANVCLISAALVSETPPTLQLNFEPAGKPGKDRDYYTEEKRNVCVVCGSDRDCIRKSIVPHEYRRSEKSIAALKGMWQYARDKVRNCYWKNGNLKFFCILALGPIDITGNSL